MNQLRLLRPSKIPLLVLSFLSGFAALGHEVLWTRRFVDLFGASAETFSRVVGFFFLGLSLGAWISTRLAKTSTPLNRVVFAELGIALFGAVVLLGSHLWLTGAHIFPANFLRWLISASLIIPPAMFMGLVLPQLVKVADAATIDANPVLLYAINTLGGVLGIGAAMLLLPRFGLTGAGVIIVSANALAACLALFLSNKYRLSTAMEPGQDKGLSLGMKLAAFASGFGVLGAEVIIQHQVAQVTINSLFAGATVLEVVLIALATAAFLLNITRVRKWLSIERATIIAAAACLVQPFVFVFWTNGLQILPYELPVLAYLTRVGSLAAVTIVPVFVAVGLIFPWLLCGQNGRSIGVLLAINGLGGWLGTELMQRYIAPGMGLWVPMILAGIGYLGLFWFVARPTPYRRIVFLLGLSAGSLAIWGAQDLSQAALGSQERLLGIKAGREGVVAAVKCGEGDYRMLFNNSYTLGGSRAQFNQERQAHLPVVLHGAARNVGILGVATGSTVAGAALHKNLERIEAIELSPVVLEYAQKFFAPFNRNVFNDQRVKFAVEDARWIISRRNGAYDVVIGDLFLPWRTGEGRLFTREHFVRVRQSLRKDGIFCQWLPLFQLTRSQFESILHTFQTVFPEAFLVRGDFYSDLPIIGLVGGRRLTDLDWERIAEACAHLRNGETTDPLIRHQEGVAMCILGTPPEVNRAPVNTLGNSWLEFDAARNIVGMKSPWFIGVAGAEYFRDVQRANTAAMPVALRSAHEAGQFFLTVDVANRLKLPVVGELESQIGERLPEALQRDPGADWKHWPSGFKFAVDRFSEKR